MTKKAKVPDREGLIKKLLQDANLFRDYSERKSFSKQASFLHDMLQDFKRLFDGEAKFLYECLTIRFVPILANLIRKYKRHPKNLVLKALLIMA